MTRSALDTPMMRQYLAVKAQHPEAILFYRMGDFYEMFLRDAEIAAPLLDIALTTRDRGKPDAVPMCGVPVHSAAPHVKKLAELGYRVAICEQVEDARAAGGRRLVRREVVEVVTPGLAGDPEDLEGSQESTLAVLDFDAQGAPGLALLDATTGDFRATRLPGAGPGAALPALLAAELARAAPRELLLRSDLPEGLRAWIRREHPGIVLSPLAPERFEPRHAPSAPQGFDAAAQDAATRAAAGLLAYLGDHQPFLLGQVGRLRHYALSDAMVLDETTQDHLELFRNSEDGTRAGTLIARIDRSVTPLGARRLRRWLAYPLIAPEAILERQALVAALAERDRARARLREALRPLRDLERLLSKVARPSATPRDLAALRDSLEALPGVARALAGDGDALWSGDDWPPGLALPEPQPEIVERLRSGLVDEPPAIPKGSRGAGEIGYIRGGFVAELDALREAMEKGRDWLAELEAQERARSGIASLKIRFHPVHGYALEVSKSQLDKVPSDYERKQTLANAERFSLPALREVEQKLLGASEKAAVLERELFEALRQEALAQAAAIREQADRVATLDALAALAEVARLEGWVAPRVDAGTRLEIRAGRHPVVEAALRRSGSGDYVPNDTELDPAATGLLVLTGPNMSGKSTYLRQVALIVLLAQIGSFVPAEAALVGSVDRVFTRVGASDRLARGESTFMVEMRETAAILAQASPRSLVILDEIGRGTSTFDGLSIAWAVAEHLHDAPGLRPRTLFATHYHELTELAATRSAVGNAHFEAREWGDDVIFLRRLVAGGASRSYGIQVARLAGLPASVIARARELLARLEGGEFDPRGRPRLVAADAAEASPAAGQLGLFAPSGPNAAEAEVLSALRALDPDCTTPIEALRLLGAWRARLESGR